MHDEIKSGLAAGQNFCIITFTEQNNTITLHIDIPKSQTDNPEIELGLDALCFYKMNLQNLLYTNSPVSAVKLKLTGDGANEALKKFHQKKLALYLSRQKLGIAMILGTVICLGIGLILLGLSFPFGITLSVLSISGMMFLATAWKAPSLLAKYNKSVLPDGTDNKTLNSTPDQTISHTCTSNLQNQNTLNSKLTPDNPSTVPSDMATKKPS